MLWLWCTWGLRILCAGIYRKNPATLASRENSNFLSISLRVGGGGGLQWLDLWAFPSCGVTTFSNVGRTLQEDTIEWQTTKSADLPLLHINVESLTGEINLKKKEWNLKTELFINSFNAYLSGWDSLIEHWGFAAFCQLKGVTSPKRVVMLQSDKVLNINVA